MPTAADVVFKEIVTAILTGQLRPRDSLSERDLVARFNVSRTPVREAMQRLLERGFIERSANGLARVVDISPDEIDQLYELRTRLEGQAAAQTIRNITAEEISELQRINDQLVTAVRERDLEEMLRIRAQFHSVLVNATRNRWLAEILISLRDKAYVVRYTHWQTVDRVMETVEQHKEMIAALTDGDLASYRAIVVAQIRAALDCYQQMIVPRPVRAKAVRT